MRKTLSSARCFTLVSPSELSPPVCLACGRTFSERTFTLDYYTKRHISYQHILQLMNTHGSMRKTARILGVSHQAISNRLQRVARLSIIE